MDRGAWQAIVHSVSESDTAKHTHTHVTHVTSVRQRVYTHLNWWCLYCSALLFNPSVDSGGKVGFVIQL